MREIKFRAWNKVKKIMVHNREDASEEYWDGINCTEVELINGRMNNKHSNYIFMQYTGLKDNNKKEIYEGDIINFRSNYGSEIGKLTYCHVGEVKYCNERCMFILFILNTTSVSRITGLANMYAISDLFEVIGNIYENKELLQ